MQKHLFKRRQETAYYEIRIKDELGIRGSREHDRLQLTKL